MGWHSGADNIAGRNLVRKTMFIVTAVVLGAAAISAQPTLLMPASGTVIDYPVAIFYWEIGGGGTDSAYHFQVSTDSTFSSVLSEDSTLTAPLDTAYGFANDTIYYWRVRVSVFGGITSAWSAVWSFSTAGAWVFPAMTLTGPEDGAIGQMTEVVVMRWEPVAGDSSYQIQVATDSTFVSTVRDFSVDGSSPSGQAADLSANTQYFWRVRAVLFGGSIYQWSSVRRFKTQRFTTSGDLYWKRWRTATLTMDGPECSETGTPNPFTDYRLIITFLQMESGAEKYTMPGYFAADGNAGETHATSGNKWRVHFMNQWPGIYTWSISFRYGPNIAASDDPNAGTPLDSIDGDTGRIYYRNVGDYITDADGNYPNFLCPSQGKVGYKPGAAIHYFTPADYKNPILLLGAASPSNFLSYSDFDNTPNVSGYPRTWSAHVLDWSSADTVSTWGGSAQLGKGILGAINYLGSKNVQTLAFSTMNIGSGGDENVYPFVSTGDLTRYDCSKLDQWQKVFNHAESRGVFLALKLQMPGNESVLGGSGDSLGVTRTVYCRELIARFRHNCAIGWHLGDGNTQTTAQQRAMASYFRAHDPFGLGNVTGPRAVMLGNPAGSDSTTFSPFINDSAINCVSLESGIFDVHRLTRKWTYESARGDPTFSLVVISGVQSPSSTGTPNDTGNQAYQDSLRKFVLWGNLMARGGGTSSYFGSDATYGDLTFQSFRSRERMWNFNNNALMFFKRYLFPDGLLASLMGSADTLISNTEAFCLASSRRYGWPEIIANCEPYVVYLPNGGTTTISIAGIDPNYLGTPLPFLRVWWYNPRTGDTVLQRGDRLELMSGVAYNPPVSIGNSPTTGEDWVALILRDTGVTFVQLSSPANGTTDVNVSGTTTLRWNADANATSYRVQFATTPDFSNPILDSLMTIADTSVDVPGPLTASTAFFWRVYETAGSGTTDWSPTFNFSTPTNLTLSSPANGSSIDVSQVPTMEWYPVAGAVSYRVQMSTDSVFSSIIEDALVNDTIRATGTSWLAVGSRYYWRAREERTGSSGAWSSVWSFNITTAVLPRAVQVNSMSCTMSKGMLRYALPKPCYVSISYYDLRGRLMGTFVNGMQNAGYHSLAVPVSRWSRGVYVQIFKAGNFIKRDRLIFVR